MAKQVQLRRGTTAELSSVTGAAGEVIVDTTKDTLTVHDAYTAGGTPLLREDLDNLANNTIGLGKIATGTQGQVLYYNASGQLTTLSPGTSGQFLSTGGSGANPSWATIISKVVQVQQVSYSSVYENTASGQYDLPSPLGDWSASITPVYANSRILFQMNMQIGQEDTWRYGGLRSYFRINGGSANNFGGGAYGGAYISGVSGVCSAASSSFLMSSLNTTQPVQFKVTWDGHNDGGTLHLNQNTTGGSTTSNNNDTNVSSTITLWEIAQ